MSQEKPDIFSDLRQDFDNFWNDNFGQISLPTDNEVLEKNAKARDGLTSSSSKDGNVVDVSDTLRSIIDEVINFKNDPTADIKDILESLNIASEQFQKYKIDVDEAKIPQVDKDLMAIVLRNMMHCKIIGKNEIYQVQWFGHLLHNLKLIEIPMSRSYNKLLRTFDKYWDILVKPTYNVAKRYYKKLAGFVLHLDGKRQEKLNQIDNAFNNMDKAKTLYENSVSWKNESLKEFLMKDIENTLDKFNIIRREDQCKESVIGSQGGRVVDNHCQLLIPEGGLDHEVSFQLNVNAKKTNLPDDVLPISPVMECIPKMELYEAAKVTLPRWCETDDPNVQVIILSHAKEGDQWKPVHEECLSNAKQDIRFSTKWVNKFVATVKKCLIHHTTYKLHSDVWFSPEGNFVGVLYVKDKSVEEIWRKKLETKRYEPSRLVTNPISVKGRDLIRMELSVPQSNVVKFDKFSSDIFSVKENIAKNEHSYFTNFCLRTLPVGDERFTLKCIITHEEQVVVEVDWSETWTATPGRSIEDVFRYEIVPSFTEVDTWSRFADSSSALNLTNREINHNIDYDAPLKEQKLKCLLLWQEKNRGSGKRKGDQTDEQLIESIRRLTILHREG